MRPLSKNKLVAAVISAAAMLLSLGVLTASAPAAPNPGPQPGEFGEVNPKNPVDGPQTANIPYVAWVGEHVRLVACDPVINSTYQFVNYQVEDWSGYQFQPPNPDGDVGNNIFEAFNPGPAAFISSSEPAHKGVGCVATDYKSLNPGLARIRVVVRNIITHAVVFSHQFLVIWLTANTPTLQETGLRAAGTEIFQNELSLSGHAALEKFLGDPSGNGEFVPAPKTPKPNEDKGLLQIRVTGSFPVVKESPLSGILALPSYTLPGDWETLAATLAGSSEETEPPGANPGLWDIHGTPALDGANEGGAVNALLDHYWRYAFGNFTSGLTATIGPFDPQAANETLLSDGQLNADDAPMPALRIDVSIAANAGGSDVGGVGQLEEASKAKIYSHDFLGDTTALNLYNPYYGAYIPATDRPGVNEVSGIDGPSPGGDFPGFLNQHPEAYPFWKLLHPTNYRMSSRTECLRITGGSPEYFETPGGARTKTLYTDERGEAYVAYNPGDQFYLENLLSSTEEPGRIFKNLDGGCDLKGVYGLPIGESSITARAIYPYEPVDYPPLTSPPVVKKVNSLWQKEFYDFPKGPGSGEKGVRILVAKAQDIDGSPFAGETVCFVAQGGSIAAFLGKEVNDTANVLGFGSGNVVVGPSKVVSSPLGSSAFCVLTNEKGLAAVELINSTPLPVDVTTVFVDEAIYRDHNVLFEAPTLKPESKTEEAGAAGSPTAPSTAPASPLAGSAPALAPLTPLQKLHKALKACKRQRLRSKRLSCESKARRAYLAKKAARKA